MSKEILVSLITLFGTALGTFGGILVSSKLTNYRLSQLEKKVDKHNNLIERMYKVETKIDDIKEDIKELKG